MQIFIRKTGIITVFLTLLFCCGCSKKNSEIVLTEPSLTGEASFSENEKSGENIENKETEKEPEAEDSSDSKDDEPGDIMVHVCGAVLCEGVYELPTGSRVIDAVKAAGGFGSDADTSYVNQARVLEDGIKLKIPTVSEVASLSDSTQDDSMIQTDDSGITGASESSEESSGSKVNINTADESQLCSISGIGPGRAQKILEYRKEHGKFKTIEDIMNVSGIKEKFFAKIKDYITV